MAAEKFVDPVPPCLDLVLIGANRRLHSALRADYRGIASAAFEFCPAAAVNTLQDQFRCVSHLLPRGFGLMRLMIFFCFQEINTVVGNAPWFAHFAGFVWAKASDNRPVGAAAEKGIRRRGWLIHMC